MSKFNTDSVSEATHLDKIIWRGAERILQEYRGITWDKATLRERKTALILVNAIIRDVYTAPRDDEESNNNGNA